MQRIAYFLTMLMVTLSLPTLAQEVSREQIIGLDEQVQDIKQDVLAISTELSLLEEKLLFPSNTQVSLFISLTASDKVDLDSVEITIDGQDVAHHIYSFKELDALREGGLQRIFTGNMRTGAHAIKVGFRGKAALGTEFVEVADYQYDKGVGPGFVEIKLSGSAIGGKSVQFFDR
ncbi:hypothetical protein [Halioxenophilus sp. WMMB6]|uniref:hypothetical protein n=1 Tax=Halioxenophilus sp. WMMB6 TaxID=3073815 RepID=UPI00295EE2EC|nr:hypothetical protein [Halioxenophilus sp. WMMB6]